MSRSPYLTSAVEITHTIYHLHFDASRVLRRYRLGKDMWNLQSGFRAPLTTSGQKLYVFADGAKIVYVGKSSQKRLTNRLYGGFKASPQRRVNGFKGYAFKYCMTQADLHVFTSPTWITTPAAAEHFSPVEDVELIEAELCFLIRQSSNRWPEYQSEIHFGKFSERHLEAAKKIQSQIVESAKILPDRRLLQQ